MRLDDCIVAQMNDEGVDGIWAGMFGLCGEAYARFGGKVVHPLNRTKAVIDACRRSDKFLRHGNIRAADCTGRREILHPYFKLKPEFQREEVEYE